MSKTAGETNREGTQTATTQTASCMASRGHKPENIDDLFCTVSSLLKAFMDKNDLPYKSAKCTTPYIERRYKSVPVIITARPWVPTSAIMEGMFMIQTEPFPTMESMKEYIKMLFLKYVQPHFLNGIIEVHVVFDSPGSLPETPKELEQRRRDMKKSDSQPEHDCLDFDDSTIIPARWRGLLSCRQCKLKFTHYTANAMLDIAPSFLTNIAEVAYSINSDKEKLLRPTLYSNADESDNRHGYTVFIHMAPRNFYIVQIRIFTTLV